MAGLGQDVPTGEALADDLSLFTSFLVALFLESLLFGAFCITYAMGTWSLLRVGRAGSPSRRDWVVLGASTTMFLLALVHLALSVKTTLSGFVAHAGTIDTVYDDLENAAWIGAPIGTARFMLYVMQSLIGDSFMLYRLYLVWHGRWKVIIWPALLFFISTVFGILSAILGFFSLFFLGFSFFTNLLSSGLIMWRMISWWRLQSRTSGVPSGGMAVRQRMYQKLAEAIVQSAAVYSTASVSLFITALFSPSVGLAACLSVFPPLIGFVFSLMVLFLAKNGDSADEMRSALPGVTTLYGVRGGPTVQEEKDARRTLLF
ncbi:hypothetical protein BV20DRAFT_1057540 [Pilatotrama ljubarskyi]|nr:hypothetical protein BV20DRAFT_1057540 [Pilatotrama ljubarskyi]